MHLLKDSFKRGHKIEFNVLEKEINVATLKPYLNTENNRKYVIEFMKHAVEYEQREVIQHLLQCLYSLWMEPEMKPVIECYPEDIIAFRQHIFAWFFEMKQAMIQWIDQGNLFPSQRLIQCFDDIIDSWKWELDNNRRSSTYMSDEAQSKLQEKVIDFRKSVWLYSVTDAMNEDMVRFLYSLAKEKSYEKELESVMDDKNRTIFHLLFDKFHTDPNQIDKVVKMHRLLERLFGFEAMTVLCCMRDDYGLSVIDVLLTQLPKPNAHTK